MQDVIIGPGSPGLHRRMILASLLSLAALGIVQPIHAQTASQGETAQAQTATARDAVDTVQTFEAALLQIMKSGKQAPFKERFETLASAVDKAFDLQTILQNSIGPRWSSLSADLRTALLQTFRRYTVASWVANFDSWNGQRFEMSSDLRLVGNVVIIPTQIVPSSGSPTKLDYVMQQRASGWKVVDVLADGSISRVAVQRSDFRHLLTNGGVPALMSSLTQKINSLSDGSLA